MLLLVGLGPNVKGLGGLPADLGEALGEPSAAGVGFGFAANGFGGFCPVPGLRGVGCTSGGADSGLGGCAGVGLGSVGLGSVGCAGAFGFGFGGCMGVRFGLAANGLGGFCPAGFEGLTGLSPVGFGGRLGAGASVGFAANGFGGFLGDAGFVGGNFGLPAVGLGGSGLDGSCFAAKGFGGFSVAVGFGAGFRFAATDRCVGLVAASFGGGRRPVFGGDIADFRGGGFAFVGRGVAAGAVCNSCAP